MSFKAWVLSNPLRFAFWVTLIIFWAYIIYASVHISGLNCADVCFNASKVPFFLPNATS